MKKRLEAVRHERFKCADNRFAHGNIGTLVARGVSGFTGIEVVLASLALHDLAGSGDLNALCHGFIGLNSHTRKKENSAIL